MKIIGRIIKAASKWKGYIIVAAISMLLVTAINLVTPMAVRELMSIVAEGVLDDAVRRTIWTLTLGLLALYLVRILFQFLNNYCAHVAAWWLVSSMRGRVYSHLQSLSMKYYNDKQTGQLMARVMEDTLHFENLIAHALPDLIVSVLMFAGVLTLLFTINPTLALLTMVPLPLILILSIFMRKVRKHFRKRKIISAELMGMLQDNFSGMKEIQVFNKQDFESQKIQAKADHHAKQTMKGLFWIGFMHPTMSLLQGLGTLAVIAFGGLLALEGNLAAADITAFLLYLGLLYTPIANLARIFEDITDATTSGKRIFEILDTKSEVIDNESARDVSNLNGNIEFKDVFFDYNSEVKVLHDISFKADAGQMIALVGPTGTGKTTVTSLITRFYDVSSGSITIDGIDVRDMTLRSLREQISIVSQDVFLFNGTIAENIAYGRQDKVSMEEIIAAAKTASVHEFIDGLPNKYETLVGERGTRLSGGQKQRIAIARAVLRKSSILILDEATSAVDNETEKEIQRAINGIMGKRTIIVIAHRLSTVEKADQILYLEEGTIAERGTHLQLKKRNGKYMKMINSITS